MSEPMEPAPPAPASQAIVEGHLPVGRLINVA